MKYSNRLILLLALFTTLIITSCQNPQGTTISGTVSNASNMTYYLDRLGINSNSKESLTSNKLDPNGGFEIKLPEGMKPGIYALRIGAKPIEFIVNGSEKDIKITADLNTIQNNAISFEGAPLSTEYYDIMSKLMARKIDANRLREIAMQEADPLVAFMVASRMFTYRENFTDVHNAVFDRLQKEHPTINFLNDYKNVKDQLAKARARKEAMAKIKVGMEAPDISLPGPDGKIRKLSDYKGKVVLLDFWASWCGPCRKENPHVVEIYHKYKSQGFDVFSVSLDGLDNKTRTRLGDKTKIKMNLDRQQERWVAAIQKDKLTWDGHVSDLMKWDSQASALYGVSSIPKTFLIGRDGKIKKVDPRYDLEESLKKLLVSS